MQESPKETAAADVNALVMATSTVAFMIGAVLAIVIGVAVGKTYGLGLAAGVCAGLLDFRLAARAALRMAGRADGHKIVLRWKAIRFAILAVVLIASLQSAKVNFFTTVAGVLLVKLSVIIASLKTTKDDTDEDGNG